MCRYGFKTYKSHFACFTCRKTFKQAHYADLLGRIGKLQQYEKLMHTSINKLTEKELSLLDELNKNYREREIKCPECGGYMADLGLDFKSPKKTAEKEWKIIEGLYTIGMSFYSCGCNGIGYIPQNKRDYETYLNNILRKYEDTAASWQATSIKEYRDKTDRVKYWNERAAIIKEELAKLKLTI